MPAEIEVMIEGRIRHGWILPLANRVAGRSPSLARWLLSFWRVDLYIGGIHYGSRGFEDMEGVLWD